MANPDYTTDVCADKEHLGVARCKEDVRDSIWIGRPVYDKFGRKGEIITICGALDGSTQFNYRVWVIRLDAGGTIQVENAVNFGVPQPFDESGILYFDGDNWYCRNTLILLTEFPEKPSFRMFQGILIIKPS